MTYSLLSQFKTVMVLSFSLFFLAYLFRTLREFSFQIFFWYIYGKMRTLFEFSQTNCPWHSFVCSVAQEDSHFPLMLPCWCTTRCVNTLSTRKYISSYTSNLTDLLLVDYLVVVLVCSFDREFVVNFLPTWRQYLSLFSWTHVLFLDWCLESKVTSLDFMVSIFIFFFVVVLLMLFIVVFYYYRYCYYYCSS